MKTRRRGFLQFQGFSCKKSLKALKLGLELHSNLSLSRIKIEGNSNKKWLKDS